MGLDCWTTTCIASVMIRVYENVRGNSNSASVVGGVQRMGVFRRIDAVVGVGHREVDISVDAMGLLFSDIWRYTCCWATSREVTIVYVGKKVCKEHCFGVGPPSFWRGSI